MKFDEDAYLAMLAVYREDRQEEVRRGKLHRKTLTSGAGCSKMNCYICLMTTSECYLAEPLAEIAGALIFSSGKIPG